MDLPLGSSKGMAPGDTEASLGGRQDRCPSCLRASHLQPVAGQTRQTRAAPASGTWHLPGDRDRSRLGSRGVRPSEVIWGLAQTHEDGGGEPCGDGLEQAGLSVPLGL